MVLVARVQTQKKTKKEKNDDTVRNMWNPGTPKGHRSTTSHFNIINKNDHKESNQGNVYFVKTDRQCQYSIQEEMR